MDIKKLALKLFLLSALIMPCISSYATLYGNLMPGFVEKGSSLEAYRIQ